MCLGIGFLMVFIFFYQNLWQESWFFMVGFSLSPSIFTKVFSFSILFKKILFIFIECNNDIIFKIIFFFKIPSFSFFFLFFEIFSKKLLTGFFVTTDFPLDAFIIGWAMVGRGELGFLMAERAKAGGILEYLFFSNSFFLLSLFSLSFFLTFTQKKAGSLYCNSVGVSSFNIFCSFYVRLLSPKETKKGIGAHVHWRADRRRSLDVFFFSSKINFLSYKEKNSLSSSPLLLLSFSPSLLLSSSPLLFLFPTHLSPIDPNRHK